MSTAAPAAPADHEPAAPAAITSPTRPAPPGRVRRRAAVVVLVVLLVAVPLVAGLLGTRSSGRALDPDNPAPEGARAVAQLLGAGGVEVVRVTRASAAGQALAVGGGTSTLVVTDPQLMDPELLSGMVGAAGAVVLLGADEASLEATGAGLSLDEPADDRLSASGQGDVAAAASVSSSEGSDGSDGSDEVVAARCDDPDAVAAGEATGGGGQLRADDAAEVCFGGSYGVGATASGTPVRVLAEPEAASNDLLDVAGNAALVLRAAGSEPRVVWLVASPFDAPADAAASPVQLLPRWVLPLGLQLVVLAVAVVLWRVRRFGSLVVEPLPVVVRSVETARGRAALYRAARDRGASSDALRAAVRWRLQRRLGLAPGTPVPVLAVGAAHTVAAHAGPPSAGAAAREPWSPAAVEHLLAGPVPADDAALATLLRDLDALEAAVSRGGAAPRDRADRADPAAPADRSDPVAPADPEALP